MCQAHRGAPCTRLGASAVEWHIRRLLLPTPYLRMDVGLIRRDAPHATGMFSYHGLGMHAGIMDPEQGVIVAYGHGPKEFAMRYKANEATPICLVLTPGWTSTAKCLEHWTRLSNQQGFPRLLSLTRFKALGGCGSEGLLEPARIFPPHARDQTMLIENKAISFSKNLRIRLKVFQNQPFVIGMYSL